MKTRTVVSIVFAASAVYDGLLGLAFLFAAEGLFRWFGVTPPNHFGYVQFPALLLIAFALMFLEIARNPERGRNLIPYGIVLKASYSGIVFFYWLTTDIPGMWKPFAICDSIFLVLFAWGYLALGRRPAPAA
jgi:hypothetical protein